MTEAESRNINNLMKDLHGVVRCKDCIHYIDSPKEMTGCSFCSKHSTVTNIFSKNENWFCADGERREI